ncbi:MAG: GNAT family N-acetyltransferase [Firmicutes bacterium HGW-Firmicutes-7]|nr:MAG: GNAT family N-acetyltransferase [Firmicutes bacterium HGW-Firmicutes-7]
MDIVIRLEIADDYREVETLTREAFWDIYKPGCAEHLLIHKLRKVPAFIPELDFIACDKDKIIGNIVYSEAKVVNKSNEEFAVLCMGPLGLLPLYQGKGIGSLLMKHSITKARELGYRAIVIFGNPDYYHRFGFVNSKRYDIQTAQGDNFDAFMTLELNDNSLNGINGKYFEDPVFKIEIGEVDEFEKGFPYREKHVTDTQFK